MSTFTGVFDPVDWYSVLKDNKFFSYESSYKHVKHSPDGFSWGYGGSGPSQLAFALLLDATNNVELTTKLYQDFKWDVVSKWPQEDGWTITSEQILEWIKNYESQNKGK